MNRTQALRFELESRLKDKVIFKKEWLEDLTEEQKDMFNELYEVHIGECHIYKAKIIGLEGKYFSAYDIETEIIVLVDVSEVDLETIEWFLEQEPLT